MTARRPARRWPVATRSTPAVVVGVVAVMAFALLLPGCGSQSLSGSQLRTRAGRVCTLAQRRLAKVRTPKDPTQARAFLNRGIAILAPELTKLRRLHPPSDLAGDYRTAVDATARELAALRFSVKGLKAGNDPVVAIKTLQQQLAPLEARAAGAWETLALPACQGY